MLKKESSYKKYSLFLVGGLREQDRDYFSQLQELARNEPSIILAPNLDRKSLLKLFRESEYYWHATGLGVSEEEPELVEHFGITPLEAASSGCIVLAHDSGGPHEIFSHGKNGFLYKTQQDLYETMQLLSQRDQTELRDNAHDLVKNTYSYTQFQKRAAEIFLS
ncbi:MAG: Glycosyltransferase Gtf1 [Microgenomates bacterium OLB22]|nr:MAG: Glycosyltransferase Gtf1 [Microgenomates bacterium OLB22]